MSSASSSNNVSPSETSATSSKDSTTTDTVTDAASGRHGDTSHEPYPPMTTHWSVPQTCTWTYNAASEPVPGATGAVAWLDIEPDPGATTLSCYPSGMFTGGRTGVFSPATCPSGWTTASVAVNTNEDNEHATTTAICCSSEYSLVDTICKRSVPTVIAVPISYNESATTHEVFSSSTTTLYSATIALYTIMAMFREGDKAMLGIGDEDDIDDEDHSSALSIDAKIGLGIGSSVAGLLILGFALLLLFRCRRKVGKANSHEMDVVDGHGRDTHTAGEDSASVVSVRDTEPRPRSYGSDGEPPPAYAATTETNSLTDNDSRTSASREEIRALKAQKEAIQRRIEELESVDTDDGEPPQQPARLPQEQNGQNGADLRE